jgi:hypothetical protein
MKNGRINYNLKREGGAGRPPVSCLFNPVGILGFKTPTSWHKLHTETSALWGIAKNDVSRTTVGQKRNTGAFPLGVIFSKFPIA